MWAHGSCPFFCVVRLDNNTSLFVPEGLQFEYGNAFEEGNNEFAQNFLNKYTSALGGSDSAENKGLIEQDRIVRPENLAQLASQPAAGGNAIQDPNVAGKFPSQEVNV